MDGQTPSCCTPNQTLLDPIVGLARSLDDIGMLGQFDGLFILNVISCECVQLHSKHIILTGV